MPTLGLIDQFTVFVAPLTVAVNCWLCPCVSDALDGEIDRVSGTSAICADCAMLAFAALAAVTVTVRAEGMEEGAV